MTVRGIEYNLPKSPYQENFFGFTFYFSSKNNHKKFKDKQKNFTNEFNAKLTKRYEIQFIYNFAPLFIFYAICESRGFYIKYKEGEYNCLSEIVVKDSPL